MIMIGAAIVTIVHIIFYYKLVSPPDLRSSLWNTLVTFIQVLAAHNNISM